MNDRLNFRYYHKKKNRYLNSQTMAINNGLFVQVSFRQRDNGYFYPYIVESFNDSEIIAEQCTGFKDTSNNLLYEGDICYDALSDSFGLILFYDGKFQFSVDNAMYELCDCLPLDLHGNINENPELLEVSNDK